MRPCPFSSSRIRPGGLPESFLSRREWIKRFSLGSAVTLAGGAFKGTLLAEIAPGTNPANILKFDLGTLPTLQNLYGSMRFNLFGTVETNGIITITRGPDDVFHAVSARCTHAGCIVDAYDNTAGKDGMVCACHGSVFNIEGKLVEGVVPGQGDLPAYNTSLDGKILSVEIPGLNFKVDSITLQSVTGPTQRYRLTFPTKQGARYRVRHTPDLATPPAVHPFFTSPTGTTSVTIVTQSSPTPNPRSVYVDATATRGFYVIEMVVDEYVS
jgi:nitrite reductase/ring-hydroxylating ferredoxin subunit